MTACPSKQTGKSRPVVSRAAKPLRRGLLFFQSVVDQLAFSAAIIPIVVSDRAKKAGAPRSWCSVMSVRYRAWLKTGLLFSEKYDDLVQRKELDGLYVNDSKRPG